MLFRSQPDLDTFDEVVSLSVPDERDAMFDLIGERVDQFVGVECRSNSDASVVAFAVEVGSNDEAFVRKGVVGGGERTRTTS